MKSLAILTGVIALSTVSPVLAGESSQTAVTVSPEMLAAMLRMPGRSQTATYEDFLAVVSRPVRFYDFNSDGLSRDELDAVGTVRAQQLRVGNVAQLLRYDLDGDRAVTQAEVETVSRINQASSGGDGSMPRQFFERADLDHDGRVTLDEMLTLQPDQQKMLTRDTGPMAMVTVDADPTPETNFTLEDARAVVDALFAAYDTDRDGVLDPSEMRAAKVDG